MVFAGGFDMGIFRPATGSEGATGYRIYLRYGEVCAYPDLYFDHFYVFQ